MLAGVPAICEACGILFENANLFGGTGFRIEGMGTNCPKCGGHASILDGTYSEVEGVFQLLSGSPFTVAQVATLERAREQLSSKGSVEQDVLKALESISPEMAALATLIKQNKVKAAVIAALIALAIKAASLGSGGITIDVSSDTNINVTHVQNAPTTRVEDSILYYPHKPKEQDGGGNAKPASESPKPEDH